MGMGVNRKLFKFLLDRFTPAYNSRPLTLGAAPPTNAQVCYVLACACYSVTSLPLCALWRLIQIRNRKLPRDMTLCLLLTYMHSVMKQFRLSQMFGITPGSVSQYLYFAKGILLDVLAECREAQVKWPTVPDMDVYAQWVAERFPLIEGVCMSVEGLLLRTLTPVRRAS